MEGCLLVEHPDRSCASRDHDQVSFLDQEVPARAGQALASPSLPFISPESRGIPG
ncbi:MAG: hypothetical protein WC382_02660 [Methanoregulaceae archaeon]